MTTATTTKHGLAAQGFRYVLRQGQFVWSHPLEMAPADVDVSEMDDDEFLQFVLQVEGNKAGVLQ